MSTAVNVCNWTSKKIQVNFDNEFVFYLKKNRQNLREIFLTGCEKKYVWKNLKNRNNDSDVQFYYKEKKIVCNTYN